MTYDTLEKRRSWARRYRAANPEKIRGLNEKYRVENREELTEYQKNWKVANRDKAKRYEKNRKPRDPAKIAARQMVNLAVRCGGMPKPTICSKCGLHSSPIHAHHYAGYDYLNWLTISWLCPPCHREAHAPEQDSHRHKSPHP